MSTAKSDKKTLKVFEAELLHREPLPQNESYSHNRAYQLIPKARAHKLIGKYKLRFSEHGIEIKKASLIGQKPHRKSIPYNDIQRFYAYSSDPSVLILGVKGDGSSRRTYEFYKFKSEQVMEACNLIEKGKDDRKLLLEADAQSPPRPSFHSTQSLHSHTAKQRSRSSSKSDTEGLKQDYSIEKPVVHVQKPVNEASITQELPSVEAICWEVPMEETDNINLIEEKLSPRLRNDPKFKKLTEHVDKDTLQSMDLQYIELNQNKGNRIAAEGSVYMFVAHHYNKNGIHRSRSDSCCSNSNEDRECSIEPKITYAAL